jgi:hypothetical protein
VGFIGYCHIHVGFSKQRHVHMRVAVVIGTYKIVQVGTGEVSTTYYFQRSLSGLRDGINKFES